MNPTMDAIYLLSPQPHIVDCLMADFERRRYRRSFLVWLGVLDPQLRRRIDSHELARQQLAGEPPLNQEIDYSLLRYTCKRLRNSYHRLLPP